MPPLRRPGLPDPMPCRLETVGRVRIAEARRFEADGVREALELDRAGLFRDLLGVVQVFEYLLRGADGLLENVVNARQPLHRLIDHQQRDHKTGELAGGDAARFDLRARVGQQHRRWSMRRRSRSAARRAPAAARTADWFFSSVAAVRGTARFVLLRCRSLHHLVAAERLLQNLVQLAGMILRLAAGAPDPPARFARSGSARTAAP